MINIREAEAGDAKAVNALSHQLGYSISDEQTLQNINMIIQSKTDEAFVAVIKEQVIGWIGVSYHIQLQSPPSCEVHGLVIDDEYRNKGIGKMLVEKAKQWTKNKGTDRLRLRCNVKRNDAMRFYSNIGFKETKQQKVYEILFDIFLIET